MNENKLIIAAAGSGKTTYLVNEAISRDGNVLILTYTNSNEDVIKRRIIQKAGCIPQHITVQTWFSFLLKHGVRPYQDCLHDSLKNQEIRGMILVNQQSALRYQWKNSPVYWREKDFVKHYFSEGYKIYSDKISKFTVKCCEQSNNAIINRLEGIYSHIFVDEVQDLAGYDLALLKLLFSSSISVLLVGDPRQVTYLTHIERKYAKYKNGKIRDFVEHELGRKCICDVDETTLMASHRCTQSICSYSSQLYPDLPPTDPCTCCTEKNTTNHQGVFLIRKEDIGTYIQEHKPIQLRWNRHQTNVHPEAKVMNFGETKGETFDKVIIYPTQSMIAWIKNNSSNLSDEARAKFYVALTRARYSAMIVMDFEDNLVPNNLVKYVPRSVA